MKKKVKAKPAKKAPVAPKRKAASVPETAPPDARYPSRPGATHRIAALASATGKKVTIAGRAMGEFDGGFLLDDGTGMARVISPETPSTFSIVEVTGTVDKVSAGKPAVVAIEGRELAPAVREPRGERQWERMIMDPAAREMPRKRAAIVAEVRKFFQKRGFLEVDTPSLVAVPGMEPYLDPLETEVIRADGASGRGYLVTSPEYSLKKLLVAGLGDVFEISRSFRNREEFGGLHNPEFLMLEWYRSYASYLEVMDDAEALVRALAKSVGRKEVTFRGIKVRLDAPFERMTVTEAMQKYAALDLEANLDADSLRRTLRAKGYRPGDDERYEDLFFRVFLNEVEPCLGRNMPTILRDYPASMAALAKRSERDPRFSERFELYIAGTEIANAFTELNDPKEQAARLEEEYALRKKLKKPLFGPDRDFLDALECGMPPAGGVALGLDRLVAIMIGKERIEEARLFPAAEMFDFGKPEKKKR